MSRQGSPVMPSVMRHVLVASASLSLLAGCVSIGGGSEPPEQLLTLTSAAAAPAGTEAAGNLSTALAVQVPSVPQRLNVPRIPVWTGDSSIAYLQDAVWVQKPAQLFQKVLSETIRAQGDRLVVSAGDLEYGAANKLMGELLTMDYDAQSRAVLVRYDAVLTQADGALKTRRFEAEINNVAAEPLAVGRAINLAANQVAGEVALWVE